MLRRALPILLAVPALAAPPGGSEMVLEPETGVRFAPSQAFPGTSRRPLRAAGVGVRKRNDFPEYVLCLYVDVEAVAARLRAQGASPRDPAALARILGEADLPQAYVVQYLRHIGVNARTRFLMESLERYWAEKPFDPKRPTLQAFLPYFQREIEPLTPSQVWVDGRGSIFTRLADGPVTRTRDAVLAKSWVAMYMGTPVKDPALRAALLRDLPALLEAEAAPRPRRARP